MISKFVLGAAAFIALASVVQAQDMNMDCTEDNMMKMQQQIDAMADETKKEMAMGDMEKAKEAAKANKVADCKTHLENVMKAMMG